MIVDSSASITRKASIVLSRFLQEANLAVIPFAEEHWRVAVEAYARFGKGRHAAGLNFGDLQDRPRARLTRGLGEATRGSAGCPAAYGLPRRCICTWRYMPSTLSGNDC